jgi:hypothetical protein
MNTVINNDRIHKITIFAFILFLMGAPLFAAPAVSGVGGTVSNGQSITISGSGFGSGPTVAIFDDFEGGTNGSNVSGTNAAYGTWDATDDTPGKYTTSYHLSGLKAMTCDMTSQSRVNAKKNIPGATKIFFSVWVLIPAGTVQPGSTGGTWKPFWPDGSDTIHHDISMASYVNGSGWIICGNDQKYSNMWPSLALTVGTWQRWSVYADTTTGNGTVKCWTLKGDGSGTVVNAGSWTSINFQWAESSFQKFYLNTFGDSGTGKKPTFDDFYLATGDNAQARIEIGNNATYASCTKLAICTPNSWSSTNISAKLWQGQFGSSDSAYLFVIDSSGNVSSGYPIKFGSSGVGSTPSDTTPPATPTGVTVIIQ